MTNQKQLIKIAKFNFKLFKNEQDSFFTKANEFFYHRYFYLRMEIDAKLNYRNSKFFNEIMIDYGVNY